MGRRAAVDERKAMEMESQADRRDRWKRSKERAHAEQHRKQSIGRQRWRGKTNKGEIHRDSKRDG